MRHAKNFSGLLFFLLIACNAAKKTAEPGNKNFRLTYLNTYRVPFDLKFRETTVGGLSGIDRDAATDTYYLIADDRSDVNPARFYNATIRVSADKIDTVIFTGVHFLLQVNAQTFPNSKTNPNLTPDPESIRFFKPNKIIWTSEGERIIRSNGQNILTNPSIIIADANGHQTDSFSIPELYKMKSTESGPRRNGVFEGSSFNPAQTKLFVSVEEPLFEDGPRAGIKDSAGLIRILQFDVLSKKAETEYMYTIDPVAHEPNPSAAFRINGVPDIYALSDHELIVVERSFSTGRIPCTIKVFLIDLRTAKMNDRGIKQLPKKLLLNMDDLGIYTDNIEGVCEGPRLSNGKRSLIFVSDDNFSKTQQTQFLLFALEEK